MANVISSVKFGTTQYTITTPYAKCSTPTNTQAKVITLVGSSVFNLEAGSRINVKFVNGNSETIVPTLSIAGGTAYSVTEGFHADAGDTIEFVFTSDNKWDILSPIRIPDSVITALFN